MTFQQSLSSTVSYIDLPKTGKIKTCVGLRILFSSWFYNSSRWFSNRVPGLSVARFLPREYLGVAWSVYPNPQKWLPCAEFLQLSLFSVSKGPQHFTMDNSQIISLGVFPLRRTRRRGLGTKEVIKLLWITLQKNWLKTSINSLKMYRFHDTLSYKDDIDNVYKRF